VVAHKFKEEVYQVTCTEIFSRLALYSRSCAGYQERIYVEYVQSKEGSIYKSRKSWSVSHPRGTRNPQPLMDFEVYIMSVGHLVFKRGTVSPHFFVKFMPSDMLGTAKKRPSPRVTQGVSKPYMTAGNFRCLSLLLHTCSGELKAACLGCPNLLLQLHPPSKRRRVGPTYLVYL
jgi:hypothetical protein